MESRFPDIVQDYVTTVTGQVLFVLQQLNLTSAGKVHGIGMDVVDNTYTFSWGHVTRASTDA
ncbi:hypothetical protein AR540_01935 [Pseudomonas sp. EpS/L25]|nr:hypothetical protein AR540_01935 [Pseudomonas sp. EpS/L25]